MVNSARSVVVTAAVVITLALSLSGAAFPAAVDWQTSRMMAQTADTGLEASVIYCEGSGAVGPVIGGSEGAVGIWQGNVDCDSGRVVVHTHPHGGAVWLSTNDERVLDMDGVDAMCAVGYDEYDCQIEID